MLLCFDFFVLWLYPQSTHPSISMGTHMFRFVLMSFFLMLSACGTAVYEEAKPGTFDGTVLVMWVGGDSGSFGDGRFVYVPNFPGQSNSLKFTRSPQATAMSVVEVTPEWMYTDGGSIPRLVQPVKGLNPWGYAPAYMVHDWLFVARKCMNDGQATETEKQMANVTFRETFEIMAEMLKTLEADELISGSDVQPAAITWAVSTGISQSLWNETGECAKNRVTEEHRKQILARLQIGPVDTGQESVRIDGENVRPARIVQTFQF